MHAHDDGWQIAVRSLSLNDVERATPFVRVDCGDVEPLRCIGDEIRWERYVATVIHEQRFEALVVLMQLADSSQLKPLADAGDESRGGPPASEILVAFLVEAEIARELLTMEIQVRDAWKVCTQRLHLGHGAIPINEGRGDPLSSFNLMAFAVADSNLGHFQAHVENHRVR